MPKESRANFQIGKNGVTDGTFELLENAFSNRESLKISVMKGAGHTKDKVKEIAEEILSKLGKKYTYKIVGFTIFLHKWRREMQQGN